MTDDGVNARHPVGHKGRSVHLGRMFNSMTGADSKLDAFQQSKVIVDVNKCSERPLRSLLAPRKC